MAENRPIESWGTDILVLDDGLASLRRLAGTLSREGYRVEPAGEPEAALQVALAHPPGLILLGLTKPGERGFEACRQLNQDERTRDVPVIFISASQDLEVRLLGFEVGGVDFLSTSCHESEVLARVRAHLQLRRAQLQLQALANSEAHLRRAQEIARAGSWELDLIGGELFWSDEVYRIFGLPRGTPMDYEVFLNCVLPEDRDYVHQRWEAALAGAPYDIEHRISVGDGAKWVREKAEIEFDQAGQAIRGIGLVLDVSERKLAEEELRKRKERLEEAQRIAQIGDWEYELWTGRMTWSDEMYRIFDLNPDEYVPSARADAEFYHPDDLPTLRRALRESLCHRSGSRYRVSNRDPVRQGEDLSLVGPAGWHGDQHHRTG